MMAAVAERLADHLIITDDNPRTESAEQIVSDMLAGLRQPDSCRVQHNRQLAIKEALAAAKSGDVILIAGKGHEDYQIIGSEKLHYSDRETVIALLQEAP